MRILDHQQTLDVLCYRNVADEIAVLLSDNDRSNLKIPDRLHIPLPEQGVLLVMPASDGILGMTKLVTVHPNNQKHQLASVQGEVLVFEAATGRRLFLLDGPVVTAVRTAAISALAARTLAANPKGDLLIVGSGIQAAAHLNAFHEVLGTNRVYVSSRNFENANRFCQKYSQPDFIVEPVTDVEKVLHHVSLIVTATTSCQPVLPTSIPAETFVAAVGSFRRDMRELPESLMLRAASSEGRLVVDTMSAVREAGEFQGLDIDNTRILSLADAIRDKRCAADLTVFKSVGHALWDLAAVRVAAKRLNVQINLAVAEEH
jgi:1-piperideine-2-carboxylate/1-pyrroline-2-carboxylate reductase [NAD(P)H]